MNLVWAFDDATLSDDRRDRFALRAIPSVEEETDPQIIEALSRIELGEHVGRREQFDEILARLEVNQMAFSCEVYLPGFSTIRDKVAAHTEVFLVADKYQFLDIGTLGIKLSDLKMAIRTMRNLVEDLRLLIRSAGFAWTVLDEQLGSATNAFWAEAKVQLDHSPTGRPPTAGELVSYL